MSRKERKLRAQLKRKNILIQVSEVACRMSENGHTTRESLKAAARWCITEGKRNPQDRHLYLQGFQEYCRRLGEYAKADTHDCPGCGVPCETERHCYQRETVMSDERDQYRFDVFYDEWRSGLPEGAVSADQIDDGYYSGVSAESVVRSESHRREEARLEQLRQLEAHLEEEDCRQQEQLEEEEAPDD